jgi:GGDEF domain-containing protein
VVKKIKYRGDVMKQELVNVIRSKPEEEIYKFVFTDPLTGILNRRAYEMSSSTYVVIIDMDGLKFINDNFGHIIGDKCLCNLAKTLVRVFGPDEVYRLSGDEFAVKSNSDLELVNGLVKARRIFKAFSFGIGETLEEADTKLYKEKLEREKSGRRACRDARSCKQIFPKR